MGYLVGLFVAQRDNELFDTQIKFYVFVETKKTVESTKLTKLRCTYSSSNELFCNFTNFFVILPLGVVAVTQCRRGPKVGPGPAQIRWISGFVKSKIDGENAVVWSEK